MLSFFSIFGIHNNVNFIVITASAVVNCFHFSVSLGYTTTYRFFDKWIIELWIAFIFQYLWDTQQLFLPQNLHDYCCELLSFFSIFGIHNNLGGYVFMKLWVVNCFHFSVSLGYTTTTNLFTTQFLMLWIAFIFQYLWDTQQHTNLSVKLFPGCELLSFFSIFGIHNNLNIT